MTGPGLAVASKLIWSNYLVCIKSEFISRELPPLVPWSLGAGHSQRLVLFPRRVGRGPGCSLHPVHLPLASHTLRCPDRWPLSSAGVSRASPRIGVARFCVGGFGSRC